MYDWTERITFICKEILNNSLFYVVTQKSKPILMGSPMGLVHLR